MLTRRIISWCLYDFANSSFSAVIVGVIYPVYFVKTISPEPHTGDLWWGRSISLSMLVVALSMPFLGGIADYYRKRKVLFVTLTLLCIASTAALSLAYDLLSASLAVFVANTALESAFVFYNSFLPDITPEERLGRVSGYGFAFGYLGSAVSLLGGLWLIKEEMIKLLWPSVSIFFLLFSLPAFILLSERDDPLVSSSLPGLQRTIATLRNSLKNRNLRRFLLSYFLYKDGINTVIVFSSIYAAVTLHFSTEEMIYLYLLVQVFALFGTLLMAKPTDKWGAKRVIVLTLLIWLVVCLLAVFAREKGIFWVAALLGGLGLGSIQAASRALFSSFVPKDAEAEYFGIYALSGKSASVLGPFIFGQMSYIFGSHRPAIGAIGAVFLISLILMFKVKAK